MKRAALVNHACPGSCGSATRPVGASASRGARVARPKGGEGSRGGMWDGSGCPLGRGSIRDLGACQPCGSRSRMWEVASPRPRPSRRNIFRSIPPNARFFSDVGRFCRSEASDAAEPTSRDPGPSNALTVSPRGERVAAVAAVCDVVGSQEHGGAPFCGCRSSERRNRITNDFRESTAIAESFPTLALVGRTERHPHAAGAAAMDSRRRSRAPQGGNGPTDLMAAPGHLHGHRLQSTAAATKRRPRSVESQPRAPWIALEHSGLHGRSSPPRTAMEGTG